MRILTHGADAGGL